MTAKTPSRGARPTQRPSHDHDEQHRHAYRPPKSNTGLIFGMLVAVGAVGIVAILALVNRESPPTFAELKQQLGVSGTGQAVIPELGQVEFANRLDHIGATREDARQDKNYLYLYYKVQEGQAEIVVYRGAWEAGRARIRLIALR